MITSSAQNFEDVVLWRALGSVEAGTFVDVGAADPVEMSVTRLFSEHGWTGVNIEPAPALAEALRAARPADITIEAAAGATPGRATIHLVPDTGLSTLVSGIGEQLASDGWSVEPIEVDVRTLDEMLEEAGLDGAEIHFVKIDTEGFEGDVLRGFDLRRWRPWVLVVEATEPRAPQPAWHEWEQGVLDAGFAFCLFDGLNRFYVSPDHAELATDLSYPACVFDDGFVGGWAHTNSHTQLLVEYDNLLDSTRRIQLEHERVLEEHAAFEVEHQRVLSDHAAFEVEHQRVLSEHAAFEAEYQRVLDSYTRLEQRWNTQEESLAAARREVTALEDADRVQREGIRSMETELVDAHRQIEELEGCLDEANRRTDAVVAELDALRQSTSWRITAPIRRALDAARWRFGTPRVSSH